MELSQEIARRRTFAIISHPDAGKTTLTEKLLLYGGAIHLAGAVRAKGQQRHTTSDWMEIEKQRGISVSSSVLQFDFQGIRFNLLDTPGHQDFSEDTYRTLTAVDAAVMLLDAAKGVEPQTRKLFEVCRSRNIPILTFINKLDRPSKDPFDLLGELEQVLQIQSCPLNWPIGLGDQFRGIYDRWKKEILFFHSEGFAQRADRLLPQKVTHLEDPQMGEWILQHTPLKGARSEEAFELAREEAHQLHQRLLEEMALLETAGTPWNLSEMQQGRLTPVFFGSAMNNFGVERFLENVGSLAPVPQSRGTFDQRVIAPESEIFSGFIFKIQANMDPAHRDRVAFLRVCSGRFIKNMEVFHPRLQQSIKLSRSLNFFAQERLPVEEAWPGDIVGLLDTQGIFRIGDTLSQEKGLNYRGIPQFSPEYFCHLWIQDPMKRKQLQKGLEQLSEEGVIQVYQQRGLGQKDPILGAVGPLQFEVFQHRLQGEYHVQVRLERLPFVLARWMEGATTAEIESFDRRQDSRCVLDRDQRPVLLCQSEWTLRWSQEHYPKIRFLLTADLLNR